MFETLDIDECSADSTLCGDAMCENNDGSYTCTCETGYQLNGDMNGCDGETTLFSHIAPYYVLAFPSTFRSYLLPFFPVRIKRLIKFRTTDQRRLFP